MKFSVTLVFLVVVLVGLSGLIYSVHLDEGVFWRVGKEILEGKILYKDVWDFKPPGIYLVSSVLTLVSSKVWIARLFVMLMNSGSAWLIYKIGSAKWGGGNFSWGLFSALSWLLLLHFYQGQFWLTESFMVWWLLVVCYMGLKSLIVKGHKRKIFLFCAGVSLGAAILFNQKAVLNLLGVLIFAGIYRGVFLIVLGGVLMVWVPVGGYFYWHGAWVDFWDAVVIFPFFDYPAMLGETFNKLPELLWPLVVLGLFVWFVFPRRQMVNHAFTQLLWLFVLLPLPVILTRPYHHYWLQVLPFVILLVFGLRRSIEN